MSVEAHRHTTYEQDLNGFGKRINQLAVDHEGIRVKTNRNEADVNKLFALVEKNAETTGTLQRSVATVLGKVSVVVAMIVPATIVLVEIVKSFIK